MADLNSLIRFRKHRVDEKQKFLSQLYRQTETLEQKKDELNDKMAAERNALETQDMLEAFAYFGRFAQGIKLQMEQVDKDIKELENRIEIARADLRDAFADLKKIEITKERREAEEKAAEKRQETKEMDEIGEQRHNRSEE